MTWDWVVTEGVEPRPDALEQVHRARALMPGAVLLAAKVVGPGGALDPGSEPWPRILDKQAAVDAARVGLLAVRAVRPGALLVRTDTAQGLAVAAARTPAAMLAASGALLATGGGYLVPGAIADRAVPARREPLAARLALLRAPSWTREERLLQLFTLAGGARRRAGRARS